MSRAIGAGEKICELTRLNREFRKINPILQNAQLRTLLPNNVYVFDLIQMSLRNIFMHFCEDFFNSKKMMFLHGEALEINNINEKFTFMREFKKPEFVGFRKIQLLILSEDEIIETINNSECKNICVEPSEIFEKFDFLNISKNCPEKKFFLFRSLKGLYTREYLDKNASIGNSFEIPLGNIDLFRVKERA